MILSPDLRGCEIHGRDEMSRRVQSRGTPYWVCLACERIKSGKRQKNGERCYKRGHLKTPWTWRCYNGRWRCLECTYEVRYAKNPQAGRLNPERCFKRGHQKTPETWRFSGGRWHCVPCAEASTADRDARLRAASAFFTRMEAGRVSW